MSLEDKLLNISIKMGNPLPTQGGDSSYGPDITKSEANYRAADNPITKRCGNCIFYEKTGQRCDVVMGHIDPYKVSDYWKPAPTNREMDDNKGAQRRRT